MIITECKISNIELLYQYFLNREITGSYANGTSQFKLFDSVLITLKIYDVEAIELIHLKKLSSLFKLIERDDDPSMDGIRNHYGVPSDVFDNIIDYNNFIISCEESTNENYSFSLEPIICTRFSCLLTTTVAQMMSLIGNSISSIFKDELGKIISDLSDEKTIMNKFTSLFVTEFYKNLRVSLGNYDELVTNMLNATYSNKVKNNDVDLIKAVIPHGGVINFIPSEGEEIGIEDGLEKISQCVEDSLEDEIILYFGLNTSFYTFFILNICYELDVICPCFKTELLHSNSFFLPHKINSEFIKRYSSLFENIVTYKQSILNKKEYLDSYKALFVSYNTNMKYIIRMKVPKEKIEKKNSVFEIYEEELKGIVDKMNNSISIIKNTIDNSTKTKD